MKIEYFFIFLLNTVHTCQSLKLFKTANPMTYDCSLEYKYHRFFQSAMLSSLILLLPISTSASSDNYMYDTGARESIISAKDSLHDIALGLSPTTPISSVYDQINFVLHKYNLQERLRLAYRDGYSSDSINCIQTAAEQTLDDLNTIQTYFSVSNDSKTKLMISDAFPGQKIEFMKQGLSAVQSDMLRLLFCPHL
mmetsp:Transcript_11715/g.11770  ORF Transcript_11715/g.11770 Transcript_11715/m.11770 type:complete len:195 (-) Transcript_11715:95-679(-)